MAVIKTENKKERELTTREIDHTKYKMTNSQYKGKSAPESKKVVARIYTK